MLQSTNCGVPRVLQHWHDMDDEDDVNKLSVKLVKLLILMGSHTDFHTWWFHFQAFAMVWKFVEAIDNTSKSDLPATASTTL